MYDGYIDWVYYCSGPYKSPYAGELYKIKTDGTERTKVSDDSLSLINVVGDWIYYITQGKIFKIKTDGTGKTKLNDDISFRLNIAGGWIYYINRSDNLKIYKIKTDGTGRTEAN